MAQQPKRKPREAMPWELRGHELEAADIFALQAVSKGTANAGQQQRALEAILHKVCRHRRMSFYPGGLEGDRATIFAEGKRFVGDQIVRLLKMRPGTSNSETPEGVPIGGEN